MTTVPPIDFLAPSGRYSRCSELLASHAKTMIAFEPKVFSKVQIDATDRFAYIIFGLALLVSVVIPILNLS